MTRRVRRKNKKRYSTTVMPENNVTRCRQSGRSAPVKNFTGAACATLVAGDS
ncbi:hypothetical protein KCP71_21450 [Salmonella enterica subsp. enterica]|nr:hypothetical protein KCP71_21450 [Salmonella enterica subsp. enterica]